MRILDARITAEKVNADMGFGRTANLGTTSRVLERPLRLAHAGSGAQPVRSPCSYTRNRTPAISTCADGSQSAQCAAATDSIEELPKLSDWKLAVKELIIHSAKLEIRVAELEAIVFSRP